MKPWYRRWLELTALVVLALIFVRAAYNFGKSYAGFDQDDADAQIQRLQSENTQLKQQVTTLQDQLARSDQQSRIDRASYDNLGVQLKSLGDDNAALKEDLAFFETLMPAGGKEGITLNRFKVESDALPGEYRYRLLLLQTGTRSRNFQGRLQFVVNLKQDGKDTVMTLPAEGEPVQPYQVSFRFYQRMEGILHVAPDAIVKNVQVRVFDGKDDIPKLTQDVSVSSS